MVLRKGKKLRTNQTNKIKNIYDYYEQTKIGHKMLIKNTHMRVLTVLSIDFLLKAMVLILNRIEIMKI